MFKVFWVSSENDLSDKMEVKSIESHSENLIDVDINNDRDTEDDIGQIAVDILDLGDSIAIIAPIAWVDPSEVDIWLSRNILTISGVRNESWLYNQAKRMLVEECFYWAFSRSIILPENLGFDQIKASVEHNVITITIPKLTLISKTVKIQTN